jgi:hypothetical protein
MAGCGMGCQRCREWQEHYYWEHMDVNNIRFFKLMTGDFQQRIVSFSNKVRSTSDRILNILWYYLGPVLIFS